MARRSTVNKSFYVTVSAEDADEAIEIVDAALSEAGLTYSIEKGL